jgi:tRNA pseudouridine55 synthase
MNGIIIVDKPAGLTSHDVVLKIRKWLKIKKVGHAGTLDPLATGVLLITVGWATRLFPYLSGMDKTYTGEIKLGQATDTYDAQGQAVGPAVSNFPDEETLKKAMLAFEGEITQLPPPFSAKKINGEAAFKLARQGKKPELKPIKVQVYRFLLLDYQPPVVNFLVECSSGTYVRTLAHDLGQVLGCGAHLFKLRRLAVGTYTEEEAFTLDKIQELVASGQKEKVIIPLEYLLNDYQAVYLDSQGQKMFLQGQKFSLERVVRASSSRRTVKHPEICRVFSSQGQLLGLARFEPETRFFQPDLVFKANS